MLTRNAENMIKPHIEQLATALAERVIHMKSEKVNEQRLSEQLAEGEEIEVSK